MTSSWKKYSLGALLVATSLGASANGAVSATIYRVYVNPVNGLVLVKMNAAVTGRPACATSTSWDFGMTLPASISPVRDALAALLTAHAATRTVTLAGSGTCNAYSSAEDITNLFFY